MQSYHFTYKTNGLLFKCLHNKVSFLHKYVIKLTFISSTWLSSIWKEMWNEKIIFHTVNMTTGEITNKKWQFVIEIFKSRIKEWSATSMLIIVYAARFEAWMHSSSHDALNKKSHKILPRFKIFTTEGYALGGICGF